MRLEAMHPPSAVVAACIALWGVNGAAHAACADMRSVVSEAATMSAATEVPAGAVVGGATVTAPMCRVEGIARPSPDSEIKFEVWLPLEATTWTKRMKVSGTGGFAGSIPYTSLAIDSGQGFVAAGSNMGHDGGESPAWTLGHPEKVKDWGLRAHYYVATAAKTVANAFYGTPVKYSYFAGCSNGGRQALMVAQNYPSLFNGIVTAAPSNFYPDLLYWLLYSGKVQTPVFGQPSLLGSTQRQLITQRAVAACDAVDGLVDGQITNPRACPFNIDAMGPGGDGSLTEAEVSVAKKMYAGTVSEAGVVRYPGAMPGSEAGWNPAFADNGGYGPFIGHYVYGLESPPFDWRRDLNYSDVYDHVKSVLSPVTAAPTPDLTAFKNNGGKLIQVHGWNDPLVTPDGSIAYHRAVALFERFQGLPDALFDRTIERLTPDQVASTANAMRKRVQDFHRLFMLPAVAHCGGSTGPDAIGGGMTEPPAAYRDADHHVVNAVMRWVEDGVAPEKIVATKFSSGVPVRSRPLCVWPAEAVYMGSGDINAADSFRCEARRERAEDVSPRDIMMIQNALRQRDLMLPDR